MTRDDLLALARRVEAAQGADRELDRRVWQAFGGKIVRRTSLGLNGRTPGRRVPLDREGNLKTLPRYTADHRRAASAAALRALAEEAPHG